MSGTFGAGHVTALVCALTASVGVVSAAFLAKRRRIRSRVWTVALVLASLPSLLIALTATRLVPESYVRFEHPAAAPLGWLVVAFVALRLGGPVLPMAAPRARLVDAFTAIALLALGLAVCAPEVGLPLDRLTVVLVVDRSRSIELVPSAEERIRRELAVAEGSMRSEDRIGRVVFAAGAASEELPRPRGTPPTTQVVELGREATDVGAGIRRALSELPADSSARIVVVSDGVATRGDALSAATAALASGVPIDVVTLEQRALSDVRLVALRSPPTAAEAESVAMRVVVGAPKATGVELRVKRDGALVRRLHAEVDAGESVLRIVEESPGPGLHRYDVEVSALEPGLDESAEDNARSTFVRVRGPARALVLDGDPGQTAFVAGALRAASMQVEEGGLDALPTDIATMAGFDLIVMGDIPASAFAPERISDLAAYVTELGGGLLLLGGDRSFGPGGFSRTPLEEVSPVSFDRKQDHRRASLAEVIAIDISGSMSAVVGGRTKLDLANEAAARSASLLGAGDMLGVEHVDTAARWTIPLGPIADPKAMDAAIRAAGAGGGGIYVDVALAEAYAALSKVKVNLKHVLLFADGSDAENISPAVAASVSRAAAGGITTSVVALGHGPDVPACEDLSKRGNGRFYIVEDATRLPAVFTQETILASRSALVEKPFQVAPKSPHAVRTGVDFGEAPPLGGYVVTVAKARADVVLSGPEDDPILALWQAGLGHSAVFASDLKGRWGTAWTEWPGAARLVAQTARYVARREDDRRVRLEAEVASGELVLRASAVDDDGRLSSFRRLVASVRGPQGWHRRVALEAAGPGTYRAAVPLDAPGAYVATALDELDGAAVATAGASLGLGDELRPTGSDAAFLARLAELTGGRRRDTLAGIFEERGQRRFAYEDATAWLLGVAAFAWLFAIAARRLAWFDEPLFVRKIRPAPASSASSNETPQVASEEPLAALTRRRRETRVDTQDVEVQQERAAPPPPTPRFHATEATSARPASEPARVDAEPSGGATPAPPLRDGSNDRVPPVDSYARSENRQDDTSGPTAPDGRPLTAAEILVARRKARR